MVLDQTCAVGCVHEVWWSGISLSHVVPKYFQNNVGSAAHPLYGASRGNKGKRNSELLSTLLVCI